MRGEAESALSASSVVYGPVMPACADCGQTGEPVYFHEGDREWSCEEVSDCRERRFDDAMDENVALRQALQPFVQAFNDVNHEFCPRFDGPMALGWFNNAAEVLDAAR